MFAGGCAAELFVEDALNVLPGRALALKDRELLRRTPLAILPRARHGPHALEVIPLTQPGDDQFGREQSAALKNDALFDEEG